MLAVGRCLFSDTVQYVLYLGSVAEGLPANCSYRLGETAPSLPGLNVLSHSPLLLLLLTQATVVAFAYMLSGQRANRCKEVQRADTTTAEPTPISMDGLLFGSAFGMPGAAGPSGQPAGIPGVTAMELQLSTLVDRVQSAMAIFSATTMALREFSLFFVTLVLVLSTSCQLCVLLMNSSAAQSCVDFHRLLQQLCAGCPLGR
eukprot:jgi/Mesvir1/26784/Mv20553-RA.1